MRLRLLSCALFVAACSGSSSDPTTASNASTCGGGDHELAAGTVDPNDTQLAVGNGYVWYGHRGGANGELARIPIAGGPGDTIVGAPIAAFAIGTGGSVAWTIAPASSDSPTVIELRDPSGATTPIPLPDGVSTVNALAFDHAGNLFMLSDIVIRGFGNGVSIWRWSAERNAFDLLHKLPSGLGPLFPDGDGMAWVAPTDSGDGVRIFHEDAIGGAPAPGPEVPTGGTIIGVDAQKIYYVGPDRLGIGSIDRAALTHANEVTFPEPRPTSGTDVSVVDDTFYWRAIDGSSGDATIWRAAKNGGAPTQFASAVELGLPSVGSCAVAFLQKSDESGSWSIMTKSR
ncbi:MAG TPA: hypothetical protein VIF62_36495 [Labilithrix sp.]